MYAVIRHGGHQYRVSVGDKLFVDRLGADVGASVRLEDVLLLGGDSDGVRAGTGELAKAVVTAKVVAHRRGRKLRVMTYKAKKRHRRTLGYRSQLTELEIEDISASGAAAAPARQRAAARPTKAAVETAADPAETAGDGVAESPAVAEAEQPPAKAAARPRRAATKKTPASGEQGEKTDGA